MPYPVNPDRTKPWNALPELPFDPAVFETIPVYTSWRGRGRRWGACRGVAR